MAIYQPIWRASNKFPHYAKSRVIISSFYPHVNSFLLVCPTSTQSSDVKSPDPSSVYNTNQPPLERKIAISKKEQKWLSKTRPKQPTNPHRLKTCIIGAPNAGKSTLANKLMGWKIFLDTPGMVPQDKVKRHKLETSLLTDPHSSLFEADLIAVVQDVSTPWGKNRIDPEVLKALYLHRDIKSILILNKIDNVKKKRSLLNITRKLTNGIVGGMKIFKVEPKSKESSDILDRLTVTEHPESENNSWWKKDDAFSANTKETDENESQSANQIEWITPDMVHMKSDDLQRSTAGWSDKKASETEQRELNAPEMQPSDSSHLTGHYPRGDPDFMGDPDLMDDPDLCNDSSDGRLGEEQRLLHAHDLRQKQMWQEYAHHLREARFRVKDMHGWPHFSEVFMISAANGDGVMELKEYLMSMAEPGNWQYHPSMVTDQNPIDLARQCVWEKLLDHLPEEIPYHVQVKVVLWEEDAGYIRSAFDIICSRQRYLYHILGDGGETIRKVALEAKQELMNAFRQDMTVKLIVRSNKSRDI